MIHYILQIIAFQLLFLITYDLFLKKETFFNWNRAYLLLTPILSFVLPLFRLDFIKKNIPETYSIQLPEVLITDSPMQFYQLPEVIIRSENYLFSYVSLIPVIGYAYYIGIGISLMLFIYKIIKIVRIRKSGVKKMDPNKNITLVSLPNTNTAFSFFNTIYIGDSLSEIKKSNVIIHEKIHIREYHSLDLILFELLRIVLWFNPLIYVYQHRMTVLQEYIADAKSVTKTNKKEYYQDLLSQIFQTEKISFINTFFNHSLIKNRIVMLQKSKSKKIFQLKYLILVPIVCTMLMYTSCSEDFTIKEEKIEEQLIEQKAKLLLTKIERQGELTSEDGKKFAILMEDVSNLPNESATYKNNKIIRDLAKIVLKHKTPKSIDTGEVLFGQLDVSPIHPDCKNQTAEDGKKCFSQKIAQHVGQEFNTKIGEEIGLSGKLRIYVRFKIDKTTGKAVDIKIRGPHPKLEQEALRVINTLPIMTPGIHNGEPVSVLYSLPIVFEIKE